ncbi:hypothetical protein K438DRAFT_1957086 [Mycena galopus ATCC 62051]|nr:hypothetical protein K438DRAFT_1957086 [Mycena galopus ATCC 62051]
MFDVVGMGTLLHAWTLLLSGEDIDTIQGMKWDMAPFENFQAFILYLRGRRDLRGYCGHRYTSGVVEELFDPHCHELWRSMVGDRDVGMLVRMPKTYLKDKIIEIMGELKLQGSSERVETYDVLMAWWFKFAMIRFLRLVRSNTNLDPFTRRFATHVPLRSAAHPNL